MWANKVDLDSLELQPKQFAPASQLSPFLARWHPGNYGCCNLTTIRGKKEALCSEILKPKHWIFKKVALYNPIYPFSPPWSLLARKQSRDDHFLRMVMFTKVCAPERFEESHSRIFLSWWKKANSVLSSTQMSVGGTKHRTSIKEFDPSAYQIWPLWQKGHQCQKVNSSEGQNVTPHFKGYDDIVSWSDWTTKSLLKKLCEAAIIDPRWSQRSFTMKKTGQPLLRVTSLAGRDGLYIT